MKPRKGNTVDPAQWLAGYDDHLARAAAGAKAAGASLRQVGGTAVSRAVR